MSDSQNAVHNFGEIAKSNNPKPDPQVPGQQLKHRSEARPLDPKLQMSALSPESSATNHDFYVLNASSPVRVDAKLPDSYPSLQSYFDTPRWHSECFDYEATTASFSGAFALVGCTPIEGAELGRISPVPDSKASIVATEEKKLSDCLLSRLKDQRADLLRDHVSDAVANSLSARNLPCAANPAVDEDLRPQTDGGLRDAGEQAARASASASAPDGDARLAAVASAAWDRYSRIVQICSRMVADMRALRSGSATAPVSNVAHLEARASEVSRMSEYSRPAMALTKIDLVDESRPADPPDAGTPRRVHNAIDADWKSAVDLKAGDLIMEYEGSFRFSNLPEKSGDSPKVITNPFGALSESVVDARHKQDISGGFAARADPQIPSEGTPSPSGGKLVSPVSKPHGS